MWLLEELSPLLPLRRRSRLPVSRRRFVKEFREEPTKYPTVQLSCVYRNGWHLSELQVELAEPPVESLHQPVLNRLEEYQDYAVFRRAVKPYPEAALLPETRERDYRRGLRCM